jgi:DNA-binding HxlR family transcriptional regulator
MKLKAVECEVERLLAVIAGKWKALISSAGTSARQPGRRC